jgi:hypothetical protein
MKTLTEIRSEYPQYKDMTDRELGDALYSKFYSDMSKDEFDSAVGLSNQRSPLSVLSDAVSGMFGVSEESRQMSPNIMGAFQPLGPRTEEAQALDLLALQGATLGLPAKGLAAVGIEGPQEAVEAARELTREQKVDDVDLGMLSEALGTVPSALATGGGGLLAQMGKGAAYGTAAGLGLSERGQEATGATVGGVIGGLAPPVLSLLGVPFRVAAATPAYIRGLTKSPEKRAVERIVEQMDAAGITPEQVAARVGEKGPITFAEIATTPTLREGLQTLVGEAAAPRGAARTLVSKQLEAREAGRVDRITAEMADLPDQAVDETIGSLSALRTQKSDPLYEEAMEFKPTGFSERQQFMNTTDPVTGKSLKEISILPNVSKAIVEAKKTLKNEGYKIPKTNRFVTKNKKQETPEIMRVLDLAKRELDDDIADAINAGRNNQKRILTKQRDQLVRILDEANPSYASARGAFEEYSQLIKAAEDGANVLGTKAQRMTPRKISNFLSSASDAQKENFRVGLSQAVREKIADNKIGEVKKLLEQKNISVLRAAWPNKESFSKFESVLRREIDMAESAKEMRPKKPKASEIETGLIEKAISSATPAVTGRIGGGSPRGAGFVYAGNIARNLRAGGGMSDEEALEVARLLMASTPEDRLATLNALVDAGKVTQKSADSIISEIPLRTMAVPTTVGMGLLGQE